MAQAYRASTAVRPDADRTQSSADHLYSSLFTHTNQS